MLRGGDMKNSFERLDTFIDRLLGESGHVFLIRIARYVVSLMSVALLVICTAHFITNGHSWPFSPSSTTSYPAIFNLTSHDEAR